MLFGNWLVTSEGIQWNGEGLNRFVIDKESLTRTRQMNGQTLYDWIFIATDEDWLTQNDLYDLNFAFVYAFAKFKSDFNYEMFDASIAEQFELFEEEDEQDCS